MDKKEKKILFLSIILTCSFLLFFLYKKNIFINRKSESNLINAAAEMDGDLVDVAEIPVIADHVPKHNIDTKNDFLIEKVLTGKSPAEIIEIDNTAIEVTNSSNSLHDLTILVARDDLEGGGSFARSYRFEENDCFYLGFSWNVPAVKFLPYRDFVLSKIFKKNELSKAKLYLKLDPLTKNKIPCLV